MNDREHRLRTRIDQLLDDREHLETEIADLRKQLKTARQQRTRALNHSNGEHRIAELKRRLRLSQNALIETRTSRDHWRRRVMDTSHERRLAKERIRLRQKQEAA